MTEETDDSISFDEKNETTQCKICGQKFRFLKSLRKHELRHQGEGGFFCRTCGMPFTSALAREKHREKEHKVLRCKICNIKFASEPEYLYHINTLHDGRNCELCICSECGKQFKTKSELSHHASSKCGTVKKYKCEVCNQLLMTAGSLINHMLRHTDKRSYMCKFCAKTFVTAGQLTVHERVHTQEKAYICEVCNKGFCHRQSLITHSTIHTGVKPYQCESCGKAFSCVGNLLKHRRTRKETCGKVELTSHRVQNPSTKVKVQVNTPLTAKLKKVEVQKKIKEAVVFVERLQLEKIQKQISNGKELSDLKNGIENFNIVKSPLEQTASSSLEFQEKKNVEWIQDFKHMQIENENQIDIRENDILIEENNDLETNDFFDNESTFDNFNDLSDDSMDLVTRKQKLEQEQGQDKNQNQKVEQNLNTNEIESTKKTRATKERKQRKKHSSKEESENQSCKYCGSLYKNIAWLAKHEEKCRTVNKNMFKCSCCKNVFETKDECLNHQEFEHSDILTCKECNKTFTTPDNVKSHINCFHRGIPRKIYTYVCERCGKVFKQKALHKLHEQNNCEDILMYTCNQCNKTYANKHILKSHMRVHETTKSLLCKFCGKSFHWKGQLKIHERSHTGEKPYKCSFCPKSFSYRESLITHSTLHTGIKPYLCASCGSRFSCIGNLLKHRKTHAATCGNNVTANIKSENVVTNLPNQ